MNNMNIQIIHNRDEVKWRNMKIKQSGVEKILGLCYQIDF